MSRTRYDACAIVASDLPYDARVWKEARSLAAAGYGVKLIGSRYGLTGTTRRREGTIDVVEVGLGERAARSAARRARALATLWRETLATRARLYHAHNVHTAPAAWIASRLRRAAFVYDAHELYGEMAGRTGLRARACAVASRFVERRSVRAAEGVVTTNPSRARVLHERHGRSDVVVLRNVPALAEHVAPVDPGYPREGPVLLYQGGVYPESRAFEESVQALAHLPDVRLVILGFGRESVFARIRRCAESTGVSDRVHFLPPRPFEELIGTAAAADVGIVPIRPDSLGTSLGDTNKLHEYLMAGLPVVASDLPEIRRVVLDGDPSVGEVFDPASAESVAAAVRRVLDDPELYARRRAEARRVAVERHNWGIEEQKLYALYARLLRPARARARAMEAAT